MESRACRKSKYSAFFTDVWMKVIRPQVTGGDQGSLADQLAHMAKIAFILLITNIIPRQRRCVRCANCSPIGGPVPGSQLVCFRGILRKVSGRDQNAALCGSAAGFRMGKRGAKVYDLPINGPWQRSHGMTQVTLKATPKDNGFQATVAYSYGVSMSSAEIYPTRSEAIAAAAIKMFDMPKRLDEFDRLDTVI
jgi:hypothetical protein